MELSPNGLEDGSRPSSDSTLSFSPRWLEGKPVEEPWWPLWMLAARSQLLHAVNHLAGEGSYLAPDALRWAEWVLDQIATMPKMANFHSTPLARRNAMCQRQFERFALDLERGARSKRWHHVRAEFDELSAATLWPDFAPQASLALWSAVLDHMRAMQEASLEPRLLRPTSVEDGTSASREGYMPSRTASSRSLLLSHPDPYTELYETTFGHDVEGFARLVLRASASVLSGRPFSPFGSPVVAFRGQDRHLARPLLDRPLASRRPEVPLAIWEAMVELATVMYRGGITVLLDEWELEFERGKARMGASNRTHFDQAASSLQQAMWALTRRARMQAEPGKSPAAYWQHCSRYGPPMLWVLAQVVTARAIERGADGGAATWLKAASTIVADLDRRSVGTEVEGEWPAAAAFLAERFRTESLRGAAAEETLT